MHLPTTILKNSSFALAALISFVSVPATAQTCPALPPSPNTHTAAAAVAPPDACVPVPLPPGVGIPFRFFDDYSWRTFIALVWPASTNHRGAPDTTRSLTSMEGPRVFDSYKSDWETFQPKAATPSNWNDVAATNPCSNAADVKPGDLVLATFSEFGNIGEAGIDRLVNVLLSQNGEYVRYLAAYNELEFNQILARKLYLAANVAKPATTAPDQIANSPFGAITVKSSWIVMDGIGHPERFYIRKAWVQEPTSRVCTLKTVGLVGLHIVQKTPLRPQWIWSTFEHVSNVPSTLGNHAPATFNDGSGTTMTNAPLAPYLMKNIGAAKPPPFNVERVNPISPETATTNALWQAALKAESSVWQNYQLVMTQWPIGGTAANGGPGNTFPGTGLDKTAFANTTLETFDQRTITKSCMSCHNETRSTDFIWSLPMNAGTATTAGGAKPIATPFSTPPRMEAIQNLVHVLGNKDAKDSK